MTREMAIIALTLFLSATQMMTVAAESEEVVVVIGEDASAELSEETVQDLDVNTDVLLDYEALYGSVLDGIIEDGVYALCDIDDDGTKEMIVGYGSTADYVNMVWTVDADGALDFAGIFSNQV